MVVKDLPSWAAAPLLNTRFSLHKKKMEAVEGLLVHKKLLIEELCG